ALMGRPPATSQPSCRLGAPHSFNGGARRNFALPSEFFSLRNETTGYPTMRASLAVLLFLLVCLGAGPAWALRCGTRLVVSGDSESAVLYKCGHPDTTERRVTYRPVADYDDFGILRSAVYVPVVLDVWVYNFGPQRFMQEFSFEDGRLTYIQSLGYG